MVKDDFLDDKNGMKEEFLDECKRRVYEILRTLTDEEYCDKYDLVDQLRNNIFDDVIYYSEGEEALEKYRDEIADFWDEEGFIFVERNINPFSSGGLLDIWRGAISTACSRVAYEVLTEWVEPFVFTEEMMIDIGKHLDNYRSYVFSEKEYGGEYPYNPANFSYEHHAREIITEKKQKANVPEQLHPTNLRKTQRGRKV